MYKIKRTKSKGTAFDSPFCERRVVHRSPSFFLRGGIDLSRKERKALPSVPMHSEDVANNVVNVMADPRMSKLDIIVMASETSVKKRRENRSAASQQEAQI